MDWNCWLSNVVYRYTSCRIYWISLSLLFFFFIYIFFFRLAISFSFFFLKKFTFLFIDWLIDWLLCWVFVSVRGLSLVVASGDHSSSRCTGLSPSRPLPLRSTGSRRAGSVTVAHGPSCSVSCGIFPDQGSNPCPLHRQADSQPLRHQGSPVSAFYLCPILFVICIEIFFSPLFVALFFSPLYSYPPSVFPSLSFLVSFPSFSSL